MDKKRNSILSSGPVSLSPTGSAYTERRRQEEEERKAREQKKNNSIFSSSKKTQDTSFSSTQPTFKSNAATMGSLSERESIYKKNQEERNNRLKQDRIKTETERLNSEQKSKGQVPTSSLNNIQARVNNSKKISEIPYLNTFHNTLQNTFLPDVKSTSTQEELDQSTLKRIEQQEKVLNDPKKSERQKEKARSYIESQKGLLGKEAKSVKQQVNEQYAKDSEGHIGKSKVGNKVAEIGANLVSGFMGNPNMGGVSANNIGTDVATGMGMMARKGINNGKVANFAQNFTKNAIEGGIGGAVGGLMNNEDPAQISQNIVANGLLGGALGGGLETYMANRTPNQKYGGLNKDQRLAKQEDKARQLEKMQEFNRFDRMRRDAIEQQPLALPMGQEEAFAKNPANAEYMNELNRRTQTMSQQPQNGASSPLNVDEFYRGASSPLNVDEMYRGASSPIPQENIEFWDEYNAEQNSFNQRQNEMRNRWGNDESQWNDLEYLYNEGLRESQEQLNNRPLALPEASPQALERDMYRQRAEQKQREAQDFEANRQRFAQDMQAQTPDSRFMLPEANPNTLRAEANQRMYNDLEQQPLMLNAPSEATMYEERARKMQSEAQVNQALQEAQDEMDRMNYVIDDFIEGNGLSKKTDRRKIANMLGYDYDQISANVFQGKIADGYESPYDKPRGYYDEPLTSHKPRNQMFQNESEPVNARKEVVRPRERSTQAYQDDVRLAPKQPNIQEDFPNPTGRRNTPYQDDVSVMNNMQGYNSPAQNSRPGARSDLNIDEMYRGASSPLNIDEYYNGASSPLNVDEMYRGASSPLDINNFYNGSSSKLPEDFYSNFPNPNQYSEPIGANPLSRSRTQQGRENIIQDNVRVNRQPKAQQSTQGGFEPRFGEAPPRARGGFEPRFSEGNPPSGASSQRATTGGNATGGAERSSTNVGGDTEKLYQNEAPKRKVNPRKPGETRFGRETVYKNPNVSDEVLNELEKSDLSYETHNNKKTLQKVNEDLKQGKLIDHANDLVNKFKDKKYSMTPYDYMKSQVVGLQLSRDNEPERAAELFQLLSENAKTQGQLIQTLANFSKMTPEGALKFFDNQYKKASGKNDFIPKDLRDMVDSRIQDIANIEDTEKRAEEFAKLMRDFKEKTPQATSKRVGDIWQSWNMISMLGNPKTMGRNLLGNAIMGGVDTLSEQTFGKLVDKAMSLKTGKNTISSELGSKARADRKASKTIAKENSKRKAEWIKQGIDPTNLNMRAQGGVFKNKPMKAIEKMVNYGLNVPDEKSVSYAYERSLRNQMRASKVKEPTQDMMDIAMQEAMERTYKDDNVFSKISTGLQQALDKPTGNLKLGSKIIPFAKTPANVLKRGMEYTPLGIAEGLYKGAKGGNQRDVARLIGRGLTGTTALAPGAYLASQGLLQGELGGDRQEQNYRREMGEMANSLKLPTKNGTLNMDISPLAPAITPLLTGANIQENLKQGMGTGEAMAKAIGDSTFGALKEMPFVQGLTDFLNLMNGDVNVGEWAGGIASQLIPTLSGQLARFTDKTQADTSNDPNPITARLKAKIPGASNTVADRVNFLTGEEKKNSVFDNQLMRGLDIFLNPFNMNIQDNPKAEQYYNEVKEQGLDTTKYLPNRLKNNISAGKGYEAINLKGEDYKKYNQQYANEISRLMDSYYNDPEAFQSGLKLFNEGQTGKEREYYQRDSGKNSKKQYKKGDLKQEARPEIEAFRDRIRREMSR